METLTIKNLNLMVKLDRMAQQAYGHIATYKNDPLPNISLARLREKMKDSEPTMDKDNSIDYGYRNFNREWTTRKSVILNAFRKETQIIGIMMRYYYNHLQWVGVLGIITIINTRILLDLYTMQVKGSPIG